MGDAAEIARVLRLLQLTLLWPVQTELQRWGIRPWLQQEWLNPARHLALKGADGQVRSIESFFNIIPFMDGTASDGRFTLRRQGTDRYEIAGNGAMTSVDLCEDLVINPPYALQTDSVPRELVKLGLEILGSASGFTSNEPCTGLALCDNGDYILIDSIPYLDKHLFARGISKNQVKAVVITHLHDDHCALFPLILMPETVEILTTRAIYDVHSVPTIGATFATTYKGHTKTICVIGDNTAMSAIGGLMAQGVVGAATCHNLQRIYSQHFDLLVADGGAGAIHGDPADALKSDADRVVFVHVEHLSNRFNTTFSLASSGQRCIVLDEDSGIYTSLMNHCLSVWLGEPLSNRWSRSILAEEEIRHYNAGDVLMVQESRTRGYVYLILTGYCEVVSFDGEKLHSIAQLQAGEIIGEMAVITGSRKRNASVVASSPVTVCVFSEEIFEAFIASEGHRDKLLARWQSRLLLRQLPQFRDLVSTVLEKLAHSCRIFGLAAGQTLQPDAGQWYLLVDGSGSCNGCSNIVQLELGFIPFAAANLHAFEAECHCCFVSIARQQAECFMAEVRQFNYLLRKYCISQQQNDYDWLLGNPESTTGPD